MWWVTFLEQRTIDDFIKYFTFLTKLHEADFDFT